MKLLHLALASLLGVVFVHAAPKSNASPTVTLPSSTTPTCTQLQTSTDIADWTSDADIEKKMIIAPTATSVFWMGRVPNSAQSVEPYAVDCALKTGGVTIGMVMCQNNFVGPGRPKQGDEEAADKWNHLVSRVFAEHTTGVAYTLAGNFTSTSDYLADEFPALIKNQKVKAVLGIDPQTCAPSCYWYCPRNNTVSECQTLKFCFAVSPWPYYTRASIST